MLKITPQNPNENIQIAAGDLIDYLIQENILITDLYEKVSQTCDEILETWSEPVL